MNSVPETRTRIEKRDPVNRDGGFVLYWMTSFRRVRYNFALERAVAWAADLGNPLVVVEELRCGQRWDSDRSHRFVLQGMADNRERVKDSPALYYPFLESVPGEADSLLVALAGQSCVVVTDDYPMRLRRDAVEKAARSADVRVESVDSNGLLPLRAADWAFPTAYSFRRFLQQVLMEHLQETPKAEPLKDVPIPVIAVLPVSIAKRWPPADLDRLMKSEGSLALLPMDHSVKSADLCGGASAAENLLRTFIDWKLSRYSGQRNQPQRDVASGLSPHLHFGHISPHEAFIEIAHSQHWHPGTVTGPAQGKRSGWWGMDGNAEAFLDQLVTWRELGFNACSHLHGYDRYESLPPWALETLGKHAGDPRAHLYSYEEFESVRTHDRLWNAAQTQLVREGRIHNYLRMLWGKKILEWTPSPETALKVMIELNNKYALDGRDPNSYSGIFWILGRYDRPWGPERPVFGKVRYMSSENTARKVRVAEYIRKYAQ